MRRRHLIAAEELERLRHQARLLVERRDGGHPLPGGRRSAHRGAGLELLELRDYQFGDDIRHIAWRGSARAGRPLVKHFHAERQRRRLLVLDLHPGAYFATRGDLKAAQALRLCALIGFAALHDHDPVAAVGAGARLPWQTRSEPFLAFLRQLNRPDPAPRPQSPGELLDALEEGPGHHGETVLVSDFVPWSEADLARLERLATRRKLVAIELFDEGEARLEAVGKVHLRDPFDGRVVVIDTDDPALRRAYAEEVERHRRRVAGALEGGARHLRCATDGDPLATLEALA